jgi:hypothetical protein
LSTWPIGKNDRFSSSNAERQGRYENLVATMIPSWSAGMAESFMTPLGGVPAYFQSRLPRNLPDGWMDG